jgi:ketosteroid isomerase-like protein
MADTKEYIWQAVRDMLDGFLEGDRPKIDRYIHEDCTFWDSSEPKLGFGLKDLNAIRDRRPKVDTGPKVVKIDAIEPIIDVYDDFAVCRHILHVRHSDSRPTEVIRNTAVWRKFPEGWFLIHNHEDEL